MQGVRNKLDKRKVLAHKMLDLWAKMWFLTKNLSSKQISSFSTTGSPLRKFVHDLDRGLRRIENYFQVSSLFTSYFSPKLKQGVEKRNFLCEPSVMSSKFVY